MSQIIKDAIAQGPMQQDFECKYCKKRFTRESTLAHHMCEPKRRQLQKSEPGVRIGFNAFLRFHELTQSSNKKRTYDDFSKSPYYKAFVKFGRWAQSIRAIGVEQFIDWILKSGIKLDNWCKDKNYDAFLQQHLKKEDTSDAMARSIETMEAWGRDRDCQFNDYFRYGHPNKICHDVASGRISPWVIYCSDTGIEWLSNLNEGQLQIVYNYINPDIWQELLKKYPEDRDWCKSILREAGL